MNEPSARPKPSYVLAGALFLRLLGLCYAFAFASLAGQITGLVGERGILPARALLDALGRMGAGRAFLFAPTMFWLGVSDAALKGVCFAGLAAAVLVVVGVLQAPALAVAWALYLSLCTVGQDFLGFQWDGLLLEAGLLAVFLAPWSFRPGAWRTRAPSPIPLWLLRFLLFRLMVASGVVKLASGDPTWRNLTALRFHFETQPLPTWLGFFAHQLPDGVLSAACVAMFVVELAVPVLIFGPARLRRLAAALLIGLQLVIAATGNYAFFNVLTISLCVLLLDDAVFPKRVRERVVPTPRSVRPILRNMGMVVAALWLTLSAFALAQAFERRLRPPAPVAQIQRWMQGFRSLNHYGLFAVMTTKRSEILLEGSEDRVTWRPYRFRWKPDLVGVRPAFVAPQQPRLDWQLWFAALGTCDDNEWVITLLRRLVENAPEVTALFAENPFPEHGPRYLRTTVFDYRFTDLATWRKTGVWWTREEDGPYCPVLARPGG